MGKFKFFSLLIAAGMFAACSDNLDVNQGNGNEGDTLSGEKGYINIGINLPTTNGSSRAPYSDSFDNGEEAEYKVNDVIIALFYGADEASATCKYAFKLTKNDFSLSDDQSGNITSYYASGVRMIAAPTNGSVFALALVNPPSTFDISGDGSSDEDGGNSVLTTTLTVTSVTNTTPNPTLERLNQALTISDISDVVGKTGTPDFFMTNAPIANKKTYQYTNNLADDFKVTTLAPVIIHNSKAAAEAAANDSPIYVERVVAKTQVNIGNSGSNNADNDNTMNVTSDVPSYANATVTFEGWKLQTTNKKYYPVRRVNELSSGETVDDWNEWSKYNPTTNISSNNNRFFGNTPNPFRTYWGIDPNYTSDEAGDYDVIDTETASITWNGVGYGSTKSKIEYCLENTTTAQTMESERLTSVLLKGTFKPNGALSNNDDFFMKDNTSAIYTADQLLAWATDVLNKSEEDGVKLGNSESIAYQSPMPAEGTTITNATDILTLFDIPGTTDVQTKRANALIDAAGNNIKYYKGGVTYYYATVIEHFGLDAPVTGIINNATDYSEANHLGRFGVLRNNWYVLTINSVSGPGEPDIPDGGGVNPPDKEESYINCEINVLSWAKRSQSVDL